MSKLAVIGGSGLEKLLKAGEPFKVDTKYGQSNEIFRFSCEGVEGYFLARHGLKHALHPHKVNYRANIAALKELDVERIIAVSAVGSLRENLPPGSIVLPDDFIDFTKRRPLTMYEDRVVHVDVTEPFCPELRKAILEASDELGIDVVDGGVYCCMEGPRYETKAEIRFLRLLGGSMVGMTVATEAVLARELEICYAPICVVTNYAAGIQKKLTVSEVLEVMEKKREAIKNLVLEALKKVPEKRRCPCSRALEDASF